MYKKFNYTPTNKDLYRETMTYYEIGKQIYHISQKQAKYCLEQFIYTNDRINGSALKKHWFTVQPADIFLSHSHDDLNNVISFAGWLWDKFKLTSFIDSCSWGYCNDLLQMLDDKYCRNSFTNTYNYQLRNFTTSHVHMMLSTALTEMIDKCECIIFFNTPHSISVKETIAAIENDNKKATLSPWIYHELSTTSMIRKIQPKRPITPSLVEHADTRLEYRKSLEAEYDVSSFLESMTDIDDDTLSSWANSNTAQGSSALDTLYNLSKIDSSVEQITHWY